MGKHLNVFSVKKDEHRSFTYVDKKVLDAEYFKDVQVLVYETKRSVGDGFKAVESISDELMFSKKYQDLTKEELLQYNNVFEHQQQQNKEKWFSR